MVIPALMAAGPALFQIMGQFFQKRQDSLTSSYEKARAHAALANIQDQIAFRREESPRERALLNQSLFSRGLGNSSIADQDKSRLRRAQRRQLASLRRDEDMANRGLSLIRKQRAFSRRMFPFGIASSLAQGLDAASGRAGGENVDVPYNTASAR